MCKDRHGSVSVWSIMGCGMRVRELCVVCMYGWMHGRGLGYYMSAFSPCHTTFNTQAYNKEISPTNK